MTLPKVTDHGFMHMPENGDYCVFIDDTMAMCNRVYEDHAHNFCSHCGYKLEPAKGDGDQVCRFCWPHFTKGPRACQDCLSNRWHAA